MFDVTDDIHICDILICLWFVIKNAVYLLLQVFQDVFMHFVWGITVLKQTVRFFKVPFWKVFHAFITDYMNYALAKSEVPNIYIVGGVGFVGVLLE